MSSFLLRSKLHSFEQTERDYVLNHLSFQDEKLSRCILAGRGVWIHDALTMNRVREIHPFAEHFLSTAQFHDVGILTSSLAMVAPFTLRVRANDASSKNAIHIVNFRDTTYKQYLADFMLCDSEDSDEDSEDPNDAAKSGTEKRNLIVKGVCVGHNAAVYRLCRLHAGPGFRHELCPGPSEAVLLASACVDGSIRVFNVSQLLDEKQNAQVVQFQPVFEVPPQSSFEMFCVTSLPSGIMAIAGSDRLISLLDLSSNRIVGIKALSGHSDDIFALTTASSDSLAWCENEYVPSNYDRLIYSGSDDFSVRAWDLRTSECVFNVKHSSYAMFVRVVPDLHTVLVHFGKGRIAVWDQRMLMSSSGKGEGQRNSGLLCTFKAHPGGRFRSAIHRVSHREFLSCNESSGTARWDLRGKIRSTTRLKALGCCVISDEPWIKSILEECSDEILERIQFWSTLPELFACLIMFRNERSLQIMPCLLSRL